MTVLPTPGGDDGTWGTILNEFLEVSLNADGTINLTSLLAALGTNAPGVGGVTVTGTPTAGEVLTATSGTAATWGSGEFGPLTGDVTTSGDAATLEVTPSTATVVRSQAYQDTPERPGAVGAASLRVGVPVVVDDAQGPRLPIIDLAIGDSICAPVGASRGVTDWATLLANMESRTNGLPDSGVGMIQTNGNNSTWGARPNGSAVGAVTVASVTLGATTTVTASAFNGVVPGQIVTVSSGTGTLAAGTYVVSVSGGNCVLSAAPLTTGTATLSFSIAMTGGVSCPGFSTSWQISSSQAIGDGCTNTGAAVTVASVTLTGGSQSASVASGGFPNVSGSMAVSGTGVAFGTQVYAMSGNTLTLSAAATASGTVTLTFTRSYRRVQVLYQLQNNGDNVIFTPVGGGSPSSSLSTHSTTGGIGLWDSGDTAIPATGIYATGAAHTAGAGGAGIIIIAARYFASPTDGVVIDNVGYGGTLVESWEETTSGGQLTNWAALMAAMAALGQPYRRLYVFGGLNDAGLGATASQISGAYNTIATTVAAVSPTTELVMMGEHYGDLLTTFASVGTVNGTPTLSSTNFVAGTLPAPTIGSVMTGPGIAANSTVLAVTAGSPPTVTLSANATATATITATEIFSRQGPTYWAGVIEAIEAVAQSTGSTFVNLFEMVGDLSARATVASVTTTTGSTAASTSAPAGFAGVARGQMVYGLGIATGTLVETVSGSNLTLSTPAQTGVTATVSFYADALGISNGGLHFGDYQESLTGRDGHRLVAEAIASKLRLSRNVQPSYQWETGVASDGAVRATLPTVAGGGVTLGGFINSGDTQPHWALSGGTFLQTGMFLGPGGQTAYDTSLTRAGVGALEVGLSLAVQGLTGATAAKRWVGSTASGPPTTGTFAAGDWVTTTSGQVWICHTAGSPGTWQLANQANVAVANSATPAAPASVTDIVTITGLAQTSVITLGITGAVDGQFFTLRITDNGSQQNFATINAEASNSVAVPTSTPSGGGIMLTTHWQYNAVTSKWRICWVS